MSNVSWTSVGKGIVAGFIATIVLSAFMLMKQAMGVMPQLNPVAMIAHMMGAQTLIAGWIAHFFIGSVMWGIIYAWLDPGLPGPHWIRGIIFATGAWLVMMVVVMPMAGVGFFGLTLGMMAPIATLVLHWIFGAVLGWTYGALLPAGHAPAPFVGQKS
ncbi:MAG TPA: DUF6789 family protein [Rhodocyclaceae bacterium]|nr:DUF6789 family protein [Rhodocyclaceae bacterium]